MAEPLAPPTPCQIRSEEREQHRAAVPLRLPPLVAMLIASLISAAGAEAAARIGRDGFDVTSGVIRALPDERLGIEVPEVRAVLRRRTAPAAEIRFRYLGPTSATKPLASGEVRRQIGLKLRAQDTCNVVYVMWHIEPDRRLAVSIKRNPGQRTHTECGARGYVNLRPRRNASTAPVRIGSSHTLRAVLLNDTLTVWADGVVAWEGALPATLLDFDGPVGLRSDNAAFELAYFAGE